jgi:hypothetical protein
VNLEPFLEHLPLGCLAGRFASARIFDVTDHEEVPFPMDASCCVPTAIMVEMGQVGYFVRPTHG